MRISLILFLLAAAATVAVVLVTADEEDAAADDPGSLTLIGDSLNVGVDPYLRDLLPNWEIDAHDRVGRTTAEGIEVLRERSGTLAPVVVVSLGTNDPDGPEAAFRALVEEAVDVVGPDRCLVWATIVRNGSERTELNDVLREVESTHSNVRLVDWASNIADDPALLAGDLVHGTPGGYAFRAAETVRALRACPDRSTA